MSLLASIFLDIGRVTEERGWRGFALLLPILLFKFVILPIVMTYFHNMVGGSILIAISMHGLHNDSGFLQWRINAEGLVSYVISGLTLLAPIVVIACVVLFVSGRWLGLER